MADDYFDETDDYCPNCGGEGVVYSCHEEWACVDPEGGCDLCKCRCDWCRPVKNKTIPTRDASTPDQGREMTAFDFMGIAAIVGVYLAMGVATVCISQRDLIAPKWWAWVVVALVWPVFWFALFRGR